MLRTLSTFPTTPLTIIAIVSSMVASVVAIGRRRGGNGSEQAIMGGDESQVQLCGSKISAVGSQTHPSSRNRHSHWYQPSKRPFLNGTLDGQNEVLC